jgi:hypothetical protein
MINRAKGTGAINIGDRRHPSDRSHAIKPLKLRLKQLGPLSGGPWRGYGGGNKLRILRGLPEMRAKEGSNYR